MQNQDILRVSLGQKISFSHRLIVYETYKQFIYFMYKLRIYYKITHWYIFHLKVGIVFLIYN